MKLVAVQEADLSRLEAMFREGGPEFEENNVSHLAYWYFRNPGHPCILYAVQQGEALLGFLSSSTFPFRVGNEIRLAAILQKGLTLPAIRGTGFYKKLLVTVEDESYASGASIITGYPNHIAGPIYLAKFRYKLAEPLQVDIALPALLGKPEYTVLQSIDAIKTFSSAEQDLAIIKEESYFRWRYGNYPAGTLRILQINRGTEVVAYVFLRKYTKMRLRLWPLMDIILLDRKAIGHVVKQLRLFAGRTFRIGILYIHNNWFAELKGQYPVIHTPKKIDFMMKGRNDEETEHLKDLRWNMWLGDTDFF